MVLKEIYGTFSKCITIQKPGNRCILYVIHCRMGSPTSPPHPSLNLSIKSERTSPDHTLSVTPPARHMVQHSPMEEPKALSHSPKEYTALEREEIQKGGFSSQHAPHRDPEEKGHQSLRQRDISNGWIR